MMTEGVTFDGGVLQEPNAPPPPPPPDSMTDQYDREKKGVTE